MPQKRHTVDQIVAKLRKADVELGKGKKVPARRRPTETSGRRSRCAPGRSGSLP
jgi:hypothetical protein